MYDYYLRTETGHNKETDKCIRIRYDKVETDDREARKLWTRSSVRKRMRQWSQGLRVLALWVCLELAPRRGCPTFLRVRSTTQERRSLPVGEFSRCTHTIRRLPPPHKRLGTSICVWNPTTSPAPGATFDSYPHRQLSHPHPMIVTPTKITTSRLCSCFSVTPTSGATLLSRIFRSCRPSYQYRYGRLSRIYLARSFARTSVRERILLAKNDDEPTATPRCAEALPTGDVARSRGGTRDETSDC